MNNKKVWGFDCETFLITNQVVPRAVCWTFYNGGPRYLMDAEEGEAFLQRLLKSDAILVAQNACFDLCVASVQSTETFRLINDALNAGRIKCTKLAQILLNTADPKTDGVRTANVFIQKGEDKWKVVPSTKMEGLAWKYLNLDLGASKEGSIRTGYGDLYGIPVEQWSHAEQEYAKNDAVYVRDIYLKQLEEAEKLAHKIGVNVLKDLERQTHVEYILQMMATVIGVGINTDKIDDAVDGVMEIHDEALESALAFGLLKPNRSNDRGYSAVTSKIQETLKKCASIVGVELAVTKTGKISANKQTMEQLFTAIETCLAHGVELKNKRRLTQQDRIELAEISSALRSKMRSDDAWKEKRTFLDALKNAGLNPDNRLRYGYNGLMETGRTSSRNPNLQNIPRKGKARACIKPREGHIFLQADYSNAELRTLAQAHINEGRRTRLGEEYIKDPNFDPHLFMALHLLETEGVKLSYEEGKDVLSDKEHALYKNLKEKRQLSKIANFGYAGGLGAEQFVDYAKGYGTNLTHEQSAQLREGWLSVWEEMEDYFRTRSELTKHAEYDDFKDYNQVYHFKSTDRVRYLRKFTIACNTPFQGIASDGAKEAIIMVWNECFFDKESPLYKCIPILFVHDELVLEIPFKSQEEATKSAKRLQTLMESGMKVHTPDIPAVAEPCLTKLWTKDAESNEEEGLLTIYEGQ